MEKNKKIISLIATILFLFVISGCSQENNETPVDCITAVTCEEGFIQNQIDVDEEGCPIYECIEDNVLLPCGDPIICDDGTESTIIDYDEQGCAIYEC